MASGHGYPATAKRQRLVRFRCRSRRVVGSNGPALQLDYTCGTRLSIRRGPPCRCAKAREQAYLAAPSTGFRSRYGSLDGFEGLEDDRWALMSKFTPLHGSTAVAATDLIVMFSAAPIGCRAKAWGRVPEPSDDEVPFRSVIRTLARRSVNANWAASRRGAHAHARDARKHRRGRAPESHRKAGGPAAG